MAGPVAPGWPAPTASGAATYAAAPRAIAIAEAAKALVEARDASLNPPEWVERVPEVVPGLPGPPHPPPRP